MNVKVKDFMRKRWRAQFPERAQIKVRNNLLIIHVINEPWLCPHFYKRRKRIGCNFFAREMYNIFAPFIVTLTFFNNGARWMGETFLPLYFYNTESIFIPPLQTSVNFNKVWPLASIVTYPELNVEKDLIHSALEYARSIPDHKTCFPEVKFWLFRH